MPDLPAEKSYSGLERFMFFVTPVLFTVLLLGVLFVLFNTDLRNKLLVAGNEIPVLGSLLPSAPSSSEGIADNELRITNFNEKISELEAALSSKQAELEQAVADKTEQEQVVADLQNEVEQLKAQSDEKRMEDEEYSSHIQSLASMYGRISPSKAAPILQSMELEETVLILNAMRPEDRIRIMEKMAPTAAADATIMMKDNVPAKDRQISALQARVKRLQNSANATVNDPYLDEAQLTATFSAMAPKRAAELLLKMAETSQSKVLKILNTVGNGARSQIIAEMAATDDKLTAQLVNKIIPTK
ncbi:MotE family protein [Paenibacillus tarimensis]